MRLLLGLGLLLVAPLSFGQRFTNGSFQNPKIANGVFFYATDNVPGWLGTGEWGVANGASAWDKDGVAGQQVAFLQSHGHSASIGQTVTDLVAGQTYQISFRARRRNSGP